MRLLFVFMCLLISAPAVFAETLTLKVKSTWDSDAPGEKIIGSASGQAALEIKGQDFSTLKGDIVIAVKSMDSGNKTRDEHLRSPVWLDEATHPNITFTIGSVTMADDKSAKVAGQISIHGVSKPLEATAKILTKDAKVKITTEFEVALADFNIVGKEGVVGNKVGKSIKIKATLKGEIK